MIYAPRSRNIIFCLLMSFLLPGCATLSYYSQTIGGQIELLQKRRPIKTVIEDKGVSAEVRAKLRLVQEARIFASKVLFLPDNKSYTDYVDLKRRYVLWSVFATPALSLKPYMSCFPVVGCMSYRVYFNQASARGFADELSKRHYDVHVTGVPAYSTLGWFDDPVINSMMRWKDYDLIGTLFHELTHQKVYITGDTVFNESVAKAVEQEGLRRWMGLHSSKADYREYLLDQERERDFVRLILNTQSRLKTLYGSNMDVRAKTLAKRGVFRDLRAEYIKLRIKWHGYEGYDEWMFSGVNNAKIQAVSTYYDYVPAFRRILRERNGDIRQFYQAVEKLKQLSRSERHELLKSDRKRPASGRGLQAITSMREISGLSQVFSQADIMPLFPVYIQVPLA
ncbi:MAG TPA: aminopeptidase [Gammaproteobacteria bacterium]|nr:aminopeptidase [Gammaproteobacteria bacterium]